MFGIQNKMLSGLLESLLGHFLLPGPDGTKFSTENFDYSIFNGTFTLNNVRLNPVALVELVPLDLKPILRIAPIQYAIVATFHLTIGSRLEVTLTRPHIHLKLLDSNHLKKSSSASPDQCEPEVTDASHSADPTLSLAQSILQEDSLTGAGVSSSLPGHIPGSFTESLREAEKGGIVDPFTSEDDNDLPSTSSSSDTPQTQDAQSVVSKFLSSMANNLSISLIEPNFTIDMSESFSDSVNSTLEVFMSRFDLSAPGLNDNKKTSISFSSPRISISRRTADVNSATNNSESSSSSSSSSSLASSDEEDDDNPALSMAIADLRQSVISPDDISASKRNKFVSDASQLNAAQIDSVEETIGEEAFHSANQFSLNPESKIRSSAKDSEPSIHNILYISESSKQDTVRISLPAPNSKSSDSSTKSTDSAEYSEQMAESTDSQSKTSSSFPSIRIPHLVFNVTPIVITVADRLSAIFSLSNKASRSNSDSGESSMAKPPEMSLKIDALDGEISFAEQSSLSNCSKLGISIHGIFFDHSKGLILQDLRVYERRNKELTALLYFDRSLLETYKVTNSEKLPRDQPSLPTWPFPTWPTISPEQLDPHILPNRSSPGIIILWNNTDAPSIQTQISPTRISLDLDIIERLGILKWLNNSSSRSHKKKSDTNKGKEQQQSSSSTSARPTSRSSTRHQSMSDDGPLDIKFSLQFLRIELRCPPPPRQEMQPFPSLLSDKILPPRSGFLALDFHQLDFLIPLLGSPASSPSFDSRAVKFENPTGDKPNKMQDDYKLLSHLSVKHMFGFFAPVEATQMTGFLHIMSNSDDSQPGFSAEISRPVNNLANKSKPQSKISANINNVDIEVDKQSLDGLQLFLDDISQFSERAKKISSSTAIHDIMPSVKRLEEPKEHVESVTNILFELRANLNSVKAKLFIPYENSSYTSSLFTLERGRIIEYIAYNGKLKACSSSLNLERTLDIEFNLQNMEAHEQSMKPATVSVGDKAHKRSKSLEKRTLCARQLMTSRDEETNIDKLSNALLCMVQSKTGPEGGSANIKVHVNNIFTALDLSSDIELCKDLANFMKTPPGAFEEVVPNDVTNLEVTLSNSLLQLHPAQSTIKSSGVLYIGNLSTTTSLNQRSPKISIQNRLSDFGLLLSNNASDISKSFVPQLKPNIHKRNSSKSLSERELIFNQIASRYADNGFARLLYLSSLQCTINVANGNVYELPIFEVDVDHSKATATFCADSLITLQEFFSSLLPKSENAEKSESADDIQKKNEAFIDRNSNNLNQSISIPAEVLDSDSNLLYIDKDIETSTSVHPDSLQASVELENVESELISDVDGETITMLDPSGLQINNDYVSNLVKRRSDQVKKEVCKIRVRISNSDIRVLLYDGYDWSSTRKKIIDETKEMRKRLNRIKQSLAKGQLSEEYVAEDGSATLFNSIHIGLPRNVSDLDSEQLMSAIDDEIARGDEILSKSGHLGAEKDGNKINDNDEDEDDHSGSDDDDENWQTLPSVPHPHSSTRAPQQIQMPSRPVIVEGRSTGPSIEFVVSKASVLFEGYNDGVDGGSIDESFRDYENVINQVDVRLEKFEIVDHIKTSTWNMFLCELRSNDGGILKPTGTPMVRIHYINSKPLSSPTKEQPSRSSDDVRVKAKIRPLRMHVDQDAVDFLKGFFSFRLDGSSSSTPDRTYIRRAEIFPVTIKLDYKPKWVDYQNIRQGKMIEFMNFFNFDASEMTLRQLTLTGVTGWNRMFEMLQDIWTPDVKATQLSDVLSGISPVRSLVNVGAGMADLVLLPIEQYRKDGGITRGLQKGATSFLKSTALEAVKFGARLATGTQVILERAETAFGTALSGENVPFSGPSATRTGSSIIGGSVADGQQGTVVQGEHFSKWASQPNDVREGIGMAYTSLTDNLRSAAETIIAVPVEVMERTGRGGAAKSVVKAVPIAVLRPMIGTSEAVGKALLGLRNTLDPNAHEENTEKYKRRHSSDYS